MSESSIKFKYKLNPILKKESWEYEALKLETARAQQLVTERKQKLQDVNNIIESTKTEIRQLYKSGTSIPLERQRILDIFLRHQYVLATQKRDELQEAEKMYDHIFSQLQDKKRSLKGIEKHRDKKRKEFDTVQIRTNFLAADELWLLQKR